MYMCYAGYILESSEDCSTNYQVHVPDLHCTLPYILGLRTTADTVPVYYMY